MLRLKFLKMMRRGIKIRKYNSPYLFDKQRKNVFYLVVGVIIMKLTSGKFTYNMSLERFSFLLLSI